MKRKFCREFNIFSISAIDLFASTMGTFIVLTVVLMPYYLNRVDSSELLAQLRTQLTQTQTELANAQADIKVCQQQQGQTQQELRRCYERLTHTFLAVVMKWETFNHDVDLHVVDTQGNEFYFEKNNRHREHFVNSNAELSVDTIRGPGIEIWENPQAKPGVYQIYAHLYSRHGNLDNPLVRTTVYYRDGSKPLRELSLTQEFQKELIATVEVNRDGEVRVR